MAISRMKKLNIIGFAPDKDKVLKVIQDNELVEITSIQDAPNFYSALETEKENIENKLSNLDFAIEYISSFEEKKGGMFAALEQEIIDKKRFEEITNKIDVDKTCEEISNIYRRLSEIDNEIQHNESVISGLKEWENFDVPVEKLVETDFTQRFLVKIGVSFFNNFIEELNECEGYNYQIINQSQDYYGVFFIVYKDCYDEVMNALKKVNFESIVFEDNSGSVPDMIKKHESIISDLEKEKKDLESKSLVYVKNINDLRVAYDYLSTFYSRENAKEKVLASKYTFFIDGWIPEKYIGKLEKALKDYKDIDIATRDP